MNSLASLVLDLQAPNLAVVAAGKQNDLMSRKIAATLRDGDMAFTPPAGVAAMIRYAKPDGTAGWYDVMEDGTTPAYSISGNVITFILCEQMLTVPGCVPVEINFYTETEKLTTFSFMLTVEKSVLTDNAIISSDYYNVLSAQIQALLGATTNPPKIDPTTKNWLLWDENTGAYVDSGFSSVGTTGPQGPQGVSITTVTKASGTGAPGTTDVYNVNKSDGTVAGQFDVYNGADGEGAPGSATPLIDSGTGVVGTATAYSREDHQHPMPSAADVGAVSTDDVKYQIYNSVTDLGLTSGSATISGAYTALSDSSILICDAAEFASTEIPNTLGVIEIVKRALARSYIHLYGKASNNGDYRMFLGSGNVPTGTWETIVTSGSFVIEQFSQAQVTIAGNSNNSGSISCAKTGYTPIALAGFTTNQTTVNIVRAELVGTDVYFNMRNNASSSTTCNFRAAVLFVKE